MIARIGPEVLERLIGQDRPGEGDVEAIALTLSGTGVASGKEHAAGLGKATAKEKARGGHATFEAIHDVAVVKSNTAVLSRWPDPCPTEKAE